MAALLLLPVPSASATDDEEWRTIRSDLIARHPEYQELLALDNGRIEGIYRSAALTAFKEVQTGDLRWEDVTVQLGRTLFQRYLFPKAVQGADVHLIAWGESNAKLYGLIALMSPHECGKFAVLGVHPFKQKEINEANANVNLAIIQAYKSSDPSRSVPSEREAASLFNRAFALAEPPLTLDDAEALGNLEIVPYLRGCNIMLRLFNGISRMPPREAANLYRSIMKSHSN